MIILHNKTTIPRDGFSYYYLPPGRPDAAFTIPIGTAFNVAVTKLMAYRSMNPWLNLPPDRAAVEREITLYTFSRLVSTLGLKYTEQFFTADAEDAPQVSAYADELKKKENQTPQPSQPSLVEGVVVAVEDYAAGLATIKDWLGDALKPVSQEQAQARANICLGCPKNEVGNWLERLAANVAGVIHKQMEKKAELHLEVENEKKLFMCQACRCFLGTKVWVPIEHIKANTREATLEKLREVPRCWILQESKT